MRKTVMQVLFWGALWGLAEATLGFVLHQAAVAIPGLPGFVMFPAAFWFMRQAHRATGRAAPVFGAAVVAALLKTADFLLPGADPIRVVNPALSILLEGLAVAIVLAACARLGARPGPAAAFLSGFGWRAAFLGYEFLISLAGLPAGLATSGAGVALRFLLLESAANAALIWPMLRFGKPIRPFEIKPAYPAAALLCALAATMLL